jgi:O-antigen/teichoic acid export membrane protein
MKFPFFLKTILHNNLLKKIITLFSGSAAGQLIIFATMPILTRLFDEELFGIYILYSSTLLILKPISSLNLELSILLPKKNKDAINLFILNIITISIISFIIFISIVLFKSRILIFLKLTHIGNYIYIVPLSLLFISYTTALEYWSNRSDHFKSISINIISRSALMSSMQIGIGTSKYKMFGLIPGLIVSQIFSLILLFKLNLHSLKVCRKHISWSRMYYLLFKYKNIPIFNTIVSFTNSISNELPVILITKYFGISPAGIYGLAAKVIKAPSGLIGYSVGQVFFNEASKNYNQGTGLTSLLKKTYRNLFYLSILIFLPVIIFSFYFQFIFGENWNDVGLYVRIICPWLFIAFINSPVTSLINILGVQKTFLFFDLALLFSRFIGLYFGYAFFNNIIFSLYFYSLTGFVFNIFFIFYFLKKVNVTDSINSTKR